ncbi:MAG: cupin domain-containing protein [Longimicrobiales bacterium]
MSTQLSPSFHRWNDIPLEQVTDSLARRLITGERVMLAQVHLKQGCIVPKHLHVHEQVTYVLQGTLRLWLGEDDVQQIDVGAGEVLHIPSNLPHRAEALEPCLVLDVFSPPREDWLNGSDTYLWKRRITGS